jgi:hypothetical protein
MSSTGSGRLGWVSNCVCLRLLVPPCRSALISLSSVGDYTMRDAKAGAWWEDAAQRGMANNSAVYTGSPRLALLAVGPDLPVS